MDARINRISTMGGERGFSLIELLTVVAIIGILAAIGLPMYRDYVMRGKIVEATSGLSDLRVRIEQYYQDNRNYGSTGAACGVALPTSKYFTFTCNWGAGGTNQFFTATATGVANEGMGGFVYTIDQSNVRQTTGLPSGWGGTPANCWITTKGGTC